MIFFSANMLLLMEYPFRDRGAGDHRRPILRRIGRSKLSCSGIPKEQGVDIFLLVSRILTAYRRYMTE